jgi:hypothetical protein
MSNPASGPAQDAAFNNMAIRRTITSGRTVTTQLQASTAAIGPVTFDNNGNISNVNNLDIKGILTVDGEPIQSQLPIKVRRDVAQLNLAPPISVNDWTRLSNMDQEVSKTSSVIFDGVKSTDSINMSTNRIINLGAPINGSDAATKVYVDTRAAPALQTTGSDVVVSGAAPPSSGQILVATSATTAKCCRYW